jgi:hypothetical protein
VYPSRMPQPDDIVATGAVFQLADVVGSELLAEVRQHVQRVWIRVFGLELLRRELPAAYAKAALEQPADTAAFLYAWWIAAKKAEQKKAAQAAKPVARRPRKPPLRDTGKPCVEAFFEGKRVGCYVHFAGEKCEIAGRK